MTAEEHGLLDRIASFDFDAKLPGSFAGRLAKDNGWSMAYTLRVIAEYRRFAFLLVAAGHPVAPSDEVDQAWHQHVLFTREWEAFCRDVAGKRLHHEPGRGESGEMARFREAYQQTLNSYRRFFGEPPSDIWPADHLRGGMDLRFQRVSLRKNVVLSRDRLTEGFAFVAVLLIAGLVSVLLR